MADGSITLEAIANFSRLETAFARSQTRVEALEKQIARLESGQSRYERTAVGGFDRLIVNAAKVAGTYMTIHRAIGFVTGAIDDQIKKIEEFAKKVPDEEAARRDLVLATGGFTEAQFSRMMTETQEIGRRQGMLRAQTIGAVTSLLGGTEELDIEERILRVKLGLESLSAVFKRGLGDVPNLGTFLLSLEKSVFARPGATPAEREESTKEALAFMLKFLEQAPGSEFEEAIPAMVQGVMSEIASSRAETPEEKRMIAAASAGFQASIMNTIADITGEQARTMQAGFGVVMRKRLREAGVDGIMGIPQILDELERHGLNLEEQGIVGRAFTKEQAFVFSQKQGPIFARLAENTEAMSRATTDTLDTIEKRQEGEQDYITSLNLSRERQEAAAEHTARITGITAAGQVREIVAGAFTPRFGFGPSMEDRAIKAQRGMLAMFGGLRTPEQGIEFLSRQLLGRAVVPTAGPDLELLPFAQRPRESMAEFGRRMAELPIRTDMAETTIAQTRELQRTILDLVKAIEAKEREGELKAAIEKQTEEYRRLTDGLLEAAGGQTNPAAAAARQNAEMEN